jgi:hypothetical protein
MQAPSFIGDSEFNEQRKCMYLVHIRHFFTGYYYGIFLSDPLVDTSSLKLQTIDGAWSFRSVTLLERVARFAVGAVPDGLRREQILEILAHSCLATSFISDLLEQANTA